MRLRRFAWVGWAAPLGAALVLLAQSCSGARSHGQPEATATPEADVLTLFVDGRAPEGGDGSAARPFRQLSAALLPAAPHRLVHLAAGLYPGPFLVQDGTQLVGGSAAVLTAPAGVTVLETHGSVGLTRLLLQGGTVGLLASGALRLTDVRFSGQREGALRLGPAATLEAERTVFEAGVSGAVGVALQGDAQATLSGCSFEGPWQRGIEAQANAALTLRQSSFRGAVTALHMRGGRADVSDVTIAEGRGPALYVVGGTLHLHRVQVRGHEYALLTSSGAVVEGEDVSSTGADRAGVGLVKAKAHFQRLSLTAGGTFGGLQCISSEVAVEGLLVQGVRGTGVSTREGSLRLLDAVVTGTRDPDGSGGDGLQLRGGRAFLSHLTVRDAAGTCLLVAEGAEVVVSGATLERCHTAGLAVETRGHLSTSAVTVHTSEGPGAVATSEAELVLRGFRALATDGVLWAECANGAQVRTQDVAGLLPTLPCVEPLDTP